MARINPINKIYFELSNICNFRCDFCPITLSKRKKEYLSFELLRKGINEIVKERITDTVSFHLLGEPLLHPGIFDAVVYAKKHGLRVELTTNGSLLTEKNVSKIIDSDIDQITISMQTNNCDHHLARNTEIPFNEYYQKILKAIQMMKQTSNAIEIQVSLMNTSTGKYFMVDSPLAIESKGRGFKQELSAVIYDIYSTLDIKISYDEIHRKLLKINTDSLKIIKIDKQISVFIQLFADWGNTFTSKKVSPAIIGYCGILLKNIAVLSNGEVTICCVDYDGETSLGNLRTDSLMSLLTSEKVKTLQDGLRKWRFIHPQCQRCAGGRNRIMSVIKGLLSIYYFKGPLKLGLTKAKEIPLFEHLKTG